MYYLFDLCLFCDKQVHILESSVHQIVVPDQLVPTHLYRHQKLLLEHQSLRLKTLSKTIIKLIRLN